MVAAATTGALPLFVNGRFLMQRQTGVQRFAKEILRSLDELLGEPSQSDLRGRTALVTPCGVNSPPWLSNFHHISVGRFGQGYLWEQVDLPRATKGGVLLSLCNLGPVVQRRQVLVVHDATP